MMRLIRALLAVGMVVGVGLTPAAAATASPAADDWGALTNGELMQLHATIGCETRLMYPGRLTPCSAAMWDEYLDLTGEMRKRGLPLAAQAAGAQTFERTGDEWDPDMLDAMDEDFPEPAPDPDADPVDQKKHYEDQAKKDRKTAFNPSTSKPRAFMINTLGSVLGESMPDKWRAEQLANQHRYNHSWEGLRAQFGQDPANPNYMGQPDAYDDYVVRRAEMEEYGGTNGKKHTAPATKSSPFRKGVAGVGGGIAALMGLPFSFAIGNGVTNLVGIDSQGLVCSSFGDDVGGDMVALLTGNDCSTFWALSSDFVPNEDSSGEPVWGDLCVGSYCVEVLGFAFHPLRNVSSWQTNDLTCFAGTGTRPSGLRLWVDMGPRPAGVPSSVSYLPEGVSWSTSFISGGNAGQPCWDLDADFAFRNVHATATTSDPYATGTDWPSQGQPRRMALTVGASTPEWVEPIGGTIDQERSLVCTIEGSDGHTYTQSSATTYREGSGEMIPPECPTLPDGVRPNSISVDDSLGNELMQEDVTEAYAEWWDSYPECRTGACKLDLVTIANPTYPVSCFDLGEECAEWHSDPDKADKYECHYGIHTVDLDECNVYAVIFKPGQTTIGAPYADPITGEWSGGQSSPEVAAREMNTAVQDPDGYRTCLDEGWAEFNPVEWVFTPIKCGWEWAMVPRPAVVNVEAYRMTAAWQATPPGLIVAEISTWNLTLSANGCAGFTVNAPVIGEFQLLNACEDPGAGMAAIFKPLSSLVVVVVGIIGVTGMVSGVIGYRGLGN